MSATKVRVQKAPLDGCEEEKEATCVLALCRTAWELRQRPEQKVLTLIRGLSNEISRLVGTAKPWENI